MPARRITDPVRWNAIRDIIIEWNTARKYTLKDMSREMDEDYSNIYPWFHYTKIPIGESMLRIVAYALNKMKGRFHARFLVQLTKP